MLAPIGKAAQNHVVLSLHSPEQCLYTLHTQKCHAWHCRAIREWLYAHLPPKCVQLVLEGKSSLSTDANPHFARSICNKKLYHGWYDRPMIWTDMGTQCPHGGTVSPGSRRSNSLLWDLKMHGFPLKKKAVPWQGPKSLNHVGLPVKLLEKKDVLCLRWWDSVATSGNHRFGVHLPSIPRIPSIPKKWSTPPNHPRPTPDLEAVYPTSWFLGTIPYEPLGHQWLMNQIESFTYSSPHRCEPTIINTSITSLTM